MNADKKYFVYIVECSDGTYYTGIALDPERRIKVHNSGRGARYTRSRRPVSIVYCEEAGSRSEALKREYAVKQLTREQKEALIASGRNIWHLTE